MEIDTSTTAGKILVMSAFDRGEETEFRSAYKSAWMPLGFHKSKSHWNWQEFDYRIAPKPDPYADLKAAFERGETIQYFSHSGNIWRDQERPNFISSFEWRVKPTLKRVPLCTEELAGSLLKSPSSGAIYVPVCVAGEGVYLYDTLRFVLTFQELMDQGWLKFNGSEWLPCSKLEEAK